MNATTVRRIPLDFPDAPTLGQQFTATSGVIYEWDGTVWIDVAPPPVIPPIYVETDPLSVKLVGDTMTGALHLPLVPPVANTEAVAKLYVDQLVTAIVNIAFYIGAADASTPDCQCVFTAFSGVPNGPLPPANTIPSGEHLIVAVGGTPTTGEMAGRTLQAGDWIISDNVQWYVLPFGGQAANVASAIAVTPPVGGQTNVQSALEAMVLRAGDTMTGNLNFSSASPTRTIMWLGAGGVAPPTGAATRSVGTRLVLYPGSTTGDFGLGIESGTQWYSVPNTNAHRWYAGATQLMNLASGGLTLHSGNIDVTNDSVVNLRDPTGAQDAANKRYVDARMVGYATNGGAALTSGQWYVICTFGLDSQIDFTFSASQANGGSHQICHGLMNFWSQSGTGYGGFNIGAHAVNGTKIFNRLEISSSPSYALLGRANINATVRMGRVCRNLLTGSNAGGTLGASASGGNRYAGVDI